MSLFFGVNFFARAAVAIVCGLLDVVWEEVPSPISKARRLLVTMPGLSCSICSLVGLCGVLGYLAFVLFFLGFLFLFLVPLSGHL